MAVQNCMQMFTLHRDRHHAESLGFCTHFIGICVSLYVGQCECGLHGELFIRSFLICTFYRRDALHHPSDRVAAVMGMDMTLGYFYKLIVQQIPVCEKENIRCFIMDDRGYLIAHKGNSEVHLFRVC